MLMLSCELIHKRPCSVKEHLIALAEVVKSGLRLRTQYNTIFRTASMTQFQNIACKTIARQCIKFSPAECSLLLMVKKGGNWYCLDITQAMFRIHEVVTRVKIAVILNDWYIPTGLSENAQSMVLSQCRSGHLLKYLHHHPANIVGHPGVEDSA